MKSTLKKVSLFGFLFAWSLWMAALLDFADAVQTITINPTASSFEHVARLHSIYFDHTNSKTWIKAWEWKLNVLNWLAVSEDGTANVSASSKLVIIGWWSGNAVDWSNSWIGWWKSNKINGINNIAAIGWGVQNTTNWNYSVVAWGYGNTANDWGVVIWWSESKANGNGVALGGNKNTANDNSLALWKNATAGTNSFAWNASVGDNRARINATKWVLIWTYTPVTWAKLVVNWPIKLNDIGDSTWIKWEINVKWGCIYAYYADWTKHVLGRASWVSCWERNTCKFGRTILQDWDKVKAYRNSFATNCGTPTEVTCNNWTFSPAGYVYPYCYSLWNSML